MNWFNQPFIHQTLQKNIDRAWWMNFNLLLAARTTPHQRFHDSFAFRTETCMARVICGISSCRMVLLRSGLVALVTNHRILLSPALFIYFTLNHDLLFSEKILLRVIRTRLFNLVEFIHIVVSLFWINKSRFREAQRGHRSVGLCNFPTHLCTGVIFNQSLNHLWIRSTQKQNLNRLLSVIVFQTTIDLFDIQKILLLRLRLQFLQNIFQSHAASSSNFITLLSFFNNVSPYI